MTWAVGNHFKGRFESPENPGGGKISGDIKVELGESKVYTKEDRLAAVTAHQKASPLIVLMRLGYCSSLGHSHAASAWLDAEQ